jgi:hypothetical protein
MFQNGWFQEQAGQLDAAQAAYSRVIANAKPGTDDESLLWAKFGIGDIHQQRGDLGAAQGHARLLPGIIETSTPIKY